MSLPTWTPSEEQDLQRLQARVDELNTKKKAWQQRHLDAIHTVIDDLDIVRYSPDGAAKLMAENADRFIFVLKPFSKD